MTSQVLLPYVLALIINTENQVLLEYRTNTQWFAHYYGLVGGSIGEHESAMQALAREVYEEIGITFNSQDAQFVHVMHFMGETRPCVAFFYIIRTWQGDIINKEKNKHDHLAWFSLDNLPDQLIPRHRKALELIAQKISYSEDNWSTEKEH